MESRKKFHTHFSCCCVSACSYPMVLSLSVPRSLLLSLSPSAVLVREPYELHESGYGSFELKAKVVFNEPARRSVELLYDVRLNNPGEAAVAESRVEYVEFMVPAHLVQRFRKAGARSAGPPGFTSSSTSGQAVPGTPVPLVAPRDSSSHNRPPAASSKAVWPEKRRRCSQSPQPSAKRAKHRDDQPAKKNKSSSPNLDYLNQLCDKFEKSTRRDGLSRGPGRPPPAPARSWSENERRSSGTQKQAWRKHGSAELNSSGRETSSSEGAPSPVSAPPSPATFSIIPVQPADLLRFGGSSSSSKRHGHKAKQSTQSHSSSSSQKHSQTARPREEKLSSKGHSASSSSSLLKKAVSPKKPTSLREESPKRPPHPSERGAEKEKPAVDPGRSKGRQYARVASHAPEIDPDSPEIDQSCQCCTGDRQHTTNNKNEAPNPASHCQLVDLQTSITHLTDSKRLQAIVDLIEPFNMLSASARHVEFDLRRLPSTVLNRLQAMLGTGSVRR